MSARWLNRSLFGTCLGLLLTGCGGSNSTPQNAVVVPDPSVKVGAVAAAPAGGAAAPTAAPAGGAAAPTPTPAAETAKAAPVKADGWGTLKGKISFDGAAPTLPDLVAKGDAGAKDSATCAKETIKNEKIVVDGASKGVKNVLVYISKPTAVNPDAKAAAAKTEVVFDQKNCVFVPHVVGMMIGSKIQLKSSDPVPHNINSKVDNNFLNQAMAANGSGDFNPLATSRQPGQVVCDIHPWMTAFWMIFDHPYFAVTNEKGEFEIKNVPAGTQKVVVWQESTRFVTPASGKEINITPNGTTAADFTIQAAQVK